MIQCKEAKSREWRAEGEETSGRLSDQARRRERENSDGNPRLPIPKISKSAICVNLRGSSEKYEIEDFCFSGIVDCRLINYKLTTSQAEIIVSY